MSNYKSITKIGIITISSTVIMQLANFILIPILTRALGASGFGKISLYNSWCNIIIAVCSLQTTQAIIYIVVGKNKQVWKACFASMLLCSVCVFVLVSVVSIIIAHFFIQSNFFSPLIIGVLFAQAFGNYCVNYLSSIYTQSQHPGKRLALSVIIAISTSALSILLIKLITENNYKYYGRIYGFAIPYFIFGLIILYFIIIKNVQDIRLGYIMEFLPLCLPIIIHSLASFVFSQSDRLMLNYASGHSTVGIYSFAHSLASLLSVAWVTLNSFYQPFFFLYLKNMDQKLIHTTTINLLKLFTAIYTIFLFICPELAQGFGGAEFALAVKYLPIFSIGFYFNFLYSLDSNLEIYYKETGLIAKGTVLSALCNIMLNAFLIPKYSITGAAIATLISYVALYIFHNINAKRVSRKHSSKYPFSYTTMFVFIALGLALISILLKNYRLIRFSIVGVVVTYSILKIVKQKSIL